jgi:hypothetical protein
MSASIYTPIKCWQIRILHLQPGAPDSELHGELIAADLFADQDGVVLHFAQMQVEFRALSYCWGPHGVSELTGRVCIGGHDVAITKTLSQALRALRFGHQSCYVWCDALCINQRDEAEKNVQVQKMFTIYRQASATMAWLGEAGTDTPIAIDCLTDERRLEGKADVLTYNQRLYEGLADLYTRPWIRRVWVQQEVMASKNLLLRCGHLEIPFATFQEGARQFTYGDPHAPFYHLLSPQTLNSIQKSSQVLLEMRRYDPGMHHYLEFCRLTGSSQVANKCQCQEVAGHKNLRCNPECVLSTATSLLATDPRDRVYGLLGTTTCPMNAPAEIDLVDVADSDSALDIDYSKTTSEVFQDLTKYIIMRDHHLEILAAHMPPKTEDNDLGLPSWCCDWRSHKHFFRPDESVQFNASSINPRNTFRVAADVTSMGPQGESLHDARRRLLVEGHVLTEVASIDHKYKNSDFFPISINLSDHKAAELAQRFRGVYLENCAALEDRIAPGDLIIVPSAELLTVSLNGSAVEGVSHWQTALVLRPQGTEAFSYVGQARHETLDLQSWPLYDGPAFDEKRTFAIY